MVRSMRKGYSYIRFSRPEQMRGDSLRRQTEAANKWAEENGVTIDESLTDLGVSGFRGLNRTRGALGRFHALVESGKVERGSVLIIESLDRFSRQAARKVMTDFLTLINAGITIVTLMDKQVYSAERLDKDQMALFGSLMVMERAHEESKTKGERLSASWGKKRSMAGTKVITARVPGWLEVKTVDSERRVEFREHGEEIVKRIFRETIQGYGRRQVALRLKNAGYKTLNGGVTWHSSYVKKILESRATLGELQPFRRDEKGMRVPAGPPIPGYYPAAVSEAEFVRASAAKERRGTNAGRAGPSGVVNLLRGISYCACGARMTRVNKGPPPKGGIYLICVEAERKGDCTNDKRWDVAFAEDRVVSQTARIDVNRLLSQGEEKAQAGPTVADLEEGLAHLRGRLKKATEMAELDIEGAMERVIVLNDEVKEAGKLLAQARASGNRQRFEATPNQRRILMIELKARLDAATDQERAELRTRLAQEVRSAFKKVIFGPTRIAVTYRGETLYGAVKKPTDVTLVVHTEDPNDVIEMAQMSLDPETLRAQDKVVSEFLRKARERREATATQPMGTLMPRRAALDVAPIVDADDPDEVQRRI